MNRVIIGAQYGDEGKGKIVDHLSATVDFAVRFNGSGNAGHCVEKDDGTRYKVHIVPAAVFRENVICCIGAGMVIDPITLVREIDEIRKVSMSPIWVDPNVHIVTPFHVAHDEANEVALGDQKIGTTLTGNGPAYADKALRKGIRLKDLLLNPEDIAAKLYTSNSYVFGERICDNILARTLHHLGIKLSPHFVDLTIELNIAAKNKKNILFAGAHGTFLDIDHGHYPFVTSSTCTVSGIGSTGISPTRIDEVVGVIKSYTTRSGQGPIPEMDDYAVNHIRKRVNEYGTTTGRKRRIGWIDLAMVKYASMLNHFTYIAVTLLDVLSGLSHIALADHAGTHKIKGWDQDISEITSYNGLPKEAKQFIQLIESAAGVPALLISTGPARSQIIDRR